MIFKLYTLNVYLAKQNEKQLHNTYMQDDKHYRIVFATFTF